ncbi:MAG: hypothetical protein ACOYK6_02380 [Chthoniobacterales bacterium]
MTSVFFRFFKKSILSFFLVLTLAPAHSQSLELAQLHDYILFHIPAVSNRWTSKEMMNDPNFAALLDDGSLFVWGSHYNNLGIVIERPPEKNVISIFSSASGFVVLFDDQQLITTNSPFFPLDYPTPEIPQGHHVISLASNWGSFAALLENGSILCWGTLQAPILPTGQKALSLFSSGHSFCAVLEKEELGKTQAVQTIFSWGEVKTPPFSLGKQKVVSIIGNEEGFCALLDDGKLRLWGKKESIVKEPLRDSYKRVSMKEGSLCATGKSFIALLDDGNLHCWGDLKTPELPYSQGTWIPWISSQPLHAVSLISNYSGITAILQDGSFLTARVKTTGSRDTSGQWHVHKQQITDHIAVPNNKNNQPLELKYIVASDSAFTALFNNGSVLSWGDEEEGGKTPDLANNKAIEIVPSGGSFTALLENGKIQSWGKINRGGQTPELPRDSEGNEVNVQKIIGNCSWMSALLSDGTLLMWGWGIKNNQTRIHVPEGKRLFSFVSPFEKFVLYGTFLEKEYQKIAFP